MNAKSGAPHRRVSCGGACNSLNHAQPGDLKKRSSFSSFKLKMQGRPSRSPPVQGGGVNKAVDLDGLGRAVEIVGCERPPSLANPRAARRRRHGKLTLDQFKAILKALMAGGSVEYDGRARSRALHDSMSEDLVDLAHADRCAAAAQAEKATAAPSRRAAGAVHRARAAAEPAAAAPADDARRHRWRRAGRRCRRRRAHVLRHERTDSVTWERPVAGAPAVLKAAAAPAASSPAEAAPAPWGRPRRRQRRRRRRRRAAASVKSSKRSCRSQTGLTRQRSQSEGRGSSRPS